MKLRNEDIIRSQDTSPLQLFTQGIRTDTTRAWYTRKLRRIMCEILEDVLEGNFESRVKEFVQRAKDDPDWALSVLLSLSWKLRERTELPKDDADYLNPTTIPGYFKPLKKLLEMNSVSIPWKRVSVTYPEKDNILDTKGWTKENIATMLKYARNPMDRALVLVLASSGVRLGGLDLKWGDLTPVYLEGTVIITICVTVSLFEVPQTTNHYHLMSKNRFKYLSLVTKTLNFSSSTHVNVFTHDQLQKAK